MYMNIIILYIYRQLKMIEKDNNKKPMKNTYYTYIQIAQLLESLYILRMRNNSDLTCNRKHTLNTKFMDNKYMYIINILTGLLIVIYRYKTITNKKYLSLSQSKINFSFHSLQFHIRAAEFLFGHQSDNWSIFFLSLQIQRQCECQCWPCRPQTLMIRTLS